MVNYEYTACGSYGMDHRNARTANCSLLGNCLKVVTKNSRFSIKKEIKKRMVESTCLP
ncbi:UNVERIFIED_CONTAM: hypothetical protein FKN15_071304 [Acipenser sinensis]